MSGGATVPVRRSLVRISRLAIAAWVAIPSAVYALDDNQIIKPLQGAKTAAPAADSSSLVNTLTLLVAVVIAGVGAWLFLKNRRTPGAARDGRLLAIEETRSLGNRQYLVVASYEDKKFLLGVCPGRIDLLAPLHDQPRAEDRP